VKRSVFMLAASLAALPALAATGKVEVQPIPDLPLRDVPPRAEPVAEPSKWNVTLGLGASQRPRYEGAANDRLRAIPLIEASTRDGHFFAGVLRGIGYNFSDERTTSYGVRLSLGHARRENADPRLFGMGNIPYYVEPGVYFNQRFAKLFFVSGGLTRGIHGSHAELGTGFMLPLSKIDRLRFGLSANWGDSTYNQTFYGVTPLQATASGNVLTAYQAAPGIKDYSVSVNWAHNFDANWYSSLGLARKQLLGSAARSPLTQRSILPSANFIVGYRY